LELIDRSSGRAHGAERVSTVRFTGSGNQPMIGVRISPLASTDNAKPVTASNAGTD
jgi:hypothetical protein